MWKSRGKCCTVVIDSGTIDNIVYMKMVENLYLKINPHTTPYKVSSL